MVSSFNSLSLRYSHKIVTVVTIFFSLLLDIIWVIITVSECGTLAVTQQLHQLSTSQSNDVQMC